MRSRAQICRAEGSGTALEGAARLELVNRGLDPAYTGYLVQLLRVQQQGT